ncbi:BTAD domain-containing putative transcriptional regulator [Actinomadura sp. 3N508]|uniref:AfsR/SARP family transcriptional regulator n=1 Tax=Actinomadura sp. 3N508 TaxID=3375153 RepID=UPI0037B46791
MNISLLGSFRVVSESLDITPGAPKLRQVLAVLALNVNTPVSIDQLYSELWGEHPPVSAQTTLQTYIYQLRRGLGLLTGRSGEARDASRAPNDYPVLLTKAGGYELRLPDRLSIDAYQFEQLAQQGREEYRAGDVAAASSTFARALACWRGGPLVDVARGERLSAWSIRLEQQHQSVLEQRFEIELELGHHRAIVDDLSTAVDANPTHEAFAGQLMRAFQLAGRRPEALEVFRVLRERLVNELGIEPSAALQRLHQDVLADQGSVPLASGGEGRVTVLAEPTRASQGAVYLPADTDALVGRSGELAILTSYLQPGRRGSDGLRIIELHGPPGVGKTALAVRAAYRLRPHFPDGQLFLDMSESGQADARLAGVLTAALESWGAPRARIPTGVDDLAQMFRSWTADRRALIVADDVTAVSRISALLPSGSGCAVITTNRFRGRGLAVGRKVMVSRLSLEQMVELYAHVVGERQASDRMDTVRQLLDLCEGLPLAVRAVAGRLAARPDWSAERLLARLCHDQSLLLDLPAGTQSLLGTLAVNYDQLSGTSRVLLERMVRDERTCWRASDVVRNFRSGSAERLLEELVDAYLVNEAFHPVPGSNPAALVEPLCTVPPLVRLELERLLGNTEPATELPHDSRSRRLDERELVSRV